MTLMAFQTLTTRIFVQYKENIIGSPREGPVMRKTFPSHDVIMFPMASLRKLACEIFRILGHDFHNTS